VSIPRLPGFPGGGIDLGQDAFNIARKSALAVIIALAGGELLDEVTGQRNPTFDFVPTWLRDEVIKVIGAAEQTVGAPLFQTIVSGATGLDLSSAAGRQEADAVKMIERILGFAVGLPFATQKLEAGLTALLGDHAPRGLIDAVSEMPSELGVNFFIGTILERIFETAVSRPLEEAIAEQKRPARMEWPQIRSLARQKLISPEELRIRLERSGWRDVDIPLLLGLDRQLVSVSDLQQAYIFGLRDEAYVRDYLDTLGFNAEDTQLIIDVYLKRAETAGGDQLRAVAQKGYLDGHLSEAQYRARLDEAHVPPASIDLEIEAANLVKEWGRKTLTLSEIKKLFDDGVVDDHQAERRLIEAGYTEEDATALIQDWHRLKELGHPGLNENRILAYLKGGVITKAEAYDRLVELNVNPADARFLVEHPEAAPQTKAHPTERSTILAAYKDDVVDRPTALQLLLDRGDSEESARLELQVVDVNLRRGKKPRQPAKLLGEGQIIEAFKLGLAKDTWAVRELVTVGYSEADAMLLVETEIAKLAGAVPADWTVLT
jgi:hypothetical protein